MVSRSLPRVAATVGVVVLGGLVTGINGAGYSVIGVRFTMNELGL